MCKRNGNLYFPIFLSIRVFASSIPLISILPAISRHSTSSERHNRSNTAPNAQPTLSVGLRGLWVKTHRDILLTLLIVYHIPYVPTLFPGLAV